MINDAGMSEWSIVAVCKTVGRKAPDGSNPSASTNS